MYRARTAVKQSHVNMNVILIISALAVLILPVYTIFYLAPAFKDLVVEDTERRLAALATRMADELLKVDEAVTPKSITPGFIRELENVRGNFPLPKIKVFSPDGTIVYCTDPADIGKKTQKTFFPDIIATGTAHSYIAEKKIELGNGTVFTKQILETYVPIVSMELVDVVGVFEIYYDLTSTLNDINRLTRRAYLVLSIIVLVLLGAVFVSVSRAKASIRERESADREIRRQKQLLEEQNQELALLHQEAEQGSLQDHLTGLGNRRLLDIHFERSLALARRHDKKLALIILDVDHFKRYNDSKGHQAGDQALINVATVVKDQLRETDVAFRYGGEEFLILLPETPQETALLVAEKLRCAVAENTDVTISLGVMAYQQGLTTEDMIREADAALYEAKQQGRNRVVGGLGL